VANLGRLDQISGDLRSSTVKAKKWPLLGLSTDINHRLIL
jgi:hypothetical protein